MILEQFVVEINGKKQVHTSREAAQAAIDEAAGSAEILASAQAYVDTLDGSDKRKKSILNVVVDFLKFVDKGEVAEEIEPEGEVEPEPKPEPKPEPEEVELDEGEDDWMNA